MVGGHRILAEAFAQVPGDAFGHVPRVDEHERGLMLANQLGQPVVVLRPDLVRHHRIERRPRDLHADVHLTPVTFIDDRAVAGFGADEEPGDFLNGLLRR